VREEENERCSDGKHFSKPPFEFVFKIRDEAFWGRDVYVKVEYR
jgi:hypothetical protein